MLMNRWSKNGVWDRVFEQLQREQIVRLKIEAVKLDSTIVKVHPDGTGALKKRTAGQLALNFGFIPVFPPQSNRLQPWQYDKTLSRKRNEIERLFRRLKGFRRIFTRFDKLDVVFLAFLNFAFIVEALR